ncbi:MAG: DUF3885 domain-containing protein [Gaiellaceae bacterium]
MPLPRFEFEDIPYLRFELGGESTGVRRVEQAVSRAVRLFEAAIPPGHRGFLDAYLWPPGDLAHRSGAEAQLIQLLPEAAQASATRVSLGEDESEGGAVRRLTAALDLRQLDYRSLFRLIANDELGLEPAVGARVYLIDESDPLVFHMYDDRGAIVHAPSAGRLRPLYESARDWVVDRDRNSR